MSDRKVEAEERRWEWTQFGVALFAVAAFAVVACSSGAHHTPQVAGGNTLRQSKSYTPPPASIFMFVNPTPFEATPPAGWFAVPDEHTSYLNDTLDVGTHYWVFVAGASGDGKGGTQVLRTPDFSTFISAPGFVNPVFYPGYHGQSSPPPTQCSGSDAYINTFDGDYAAPGSVLTDPTGGNPIMFYEAENHCRGNQISGPYYASIGFVRALDAYGKTWPTPDPSPASRYAVLTGPEPKPSTTGLDYGDAIPAAFIDSTGGTTYVYVYFTEWDAGSSYEVVARAELGVGDPPVFHKFNNLTGMFSIGGTGTAGTDLYASTAQLGSCKDEPRGVSASKYGSYYIMTGACTEPSPCPTATGGPDCDYPGQRGVVDAIADNIATQNWSHMYEAGGFSAVGICMSAPASPSPRPVDYWQGWYPSMITPSEAPGTLDSEGVDMGADGCLTGARVIGVRGFNFGVPGPKDRRRHARPHSSPSPSPYSETNRQAVH